MEHRVLRDVMVAMRDGVELATDAYVPAGVPAPAILYRLPYDKSVRVTLEEVTRLLEAGYAVVTQDTRGRYASAGRFVPFRHEADDGVDTVAWVAAQGWCDGRVGMAGGSYFGATQWLAAAQAPPALHAIAPRVTSDPAAGYHEGWTYQGGAFQLGFALHWASAFLALPELARRARAGAATSDDVRALVAAVDGTDALYETLPLQAVDALRDGAPYYFDWLAHPDFDSWWRELVPDPAHDGVGVPSLNIGGWYDIFLGGTLANYRAARRRRAGGGANARLIVGPWGHGTSSGHFPECAFGLLASDAGFDLVGAQIRFFDRHVKQAEADDEAPVKLFVMGADAWRDEQDWPLPDTRFTSYYLHSGGHANTAAGDGTLSMEPPADEPADVFRYDPRDPVPTVGGQTFLPGLAVGANAGPRDQAAVEARHDVLCFTTPPLEADLEVTGPVTLILHAASSARDTDFTGKLVDVHPDGRAMLLTDGILRARYRRSTSTPELLEPNRPYELTIDLVATANVFRAGHRIRLEVSSSNFPRFDRNTNTGGTIAEDGPADLIVAANRVLHDVAHPSRLVLPIVERAPAAHGGSR